MLMLILSESGKITLLHFKYYRARQWRFVCLKLSLSFRERIKMVCGIFVTDFLL